MTSVRGTVTLAELSAALPPPRVVPAARAQIGAMNAQAGRHVVVLDDDPTGSRVVHDVPVLTGWDDDDLRWASGQPPGTFFLLTNTRSLAAAAASALLRDLADRLHRVDAGCPGSGSSGPRWRSSRSRPAWPPPRR